MVEMLETNHSLSQEEEWQVNEMKALLLNERETKMISSYLV